MRVDIRGYLFEVEVGTTPYDVTHWTWINDKKWEEPTFDILEKFLDGDHSYIDIGAHIGMTALYGSRKSKYCYAVDPDIIALTALRNNIVLNKLDNISTHELAISDEGGKAMLNVSAGGDSMSSMVLEKTHRKEVACKTLGDFIKDEMVVDCNFIKMDVEGNEVKILPQAKKLLSLLDISLYVSIHTLFFKNKIESLKAIADALSDYRYLYLGGEQVGLADIEQLGCNRDILCTNREIK